MKTAHGAPPTHLELSKGSRQARRRQGALQAVEPNSDTRSVSFEPQRGQATSAEASNSARLPDRRPGGEMPEAASFSRAASLMRSVVQIGVLVSLTRTSSKPSF